MSKSVTDVVEPAGYFHVSTEDSRIVLAPVHIGHSDIVRQKLAELGITQDDISDAIKWARSN